METDPPMVPMQKSDAPLMETIQAVQCVSCGTLHKYEDGRYLAIQGSYQQRVQRYGQWRDQTYPLGSNAKPTIVCMPGYDNSEADCLIKVFKPGDKK